MEIFGFSDLSNGEEENAEIEEIKRPKLRQTDIFMRAKPGAHPLEILPLRTAAQLNPLHGRHDNLIKPPFLMIVNGSVRGGKTCLISNLLFRDSFYKGVFKNIFLVTPTAHTDTSYKTFLESDNVEVHCPTSPGEFDASIADIMEKVKTKREGDEEPEHSVIVFDDIIGLTRNGDALCNLATRYRHSNVSIIIACQYFMRLGVTIRCNATCYIIFKIQNTKELNHILMELGSSFGDALESCYNKIFDKGKPFTFMVLDLRNRRIMDEFKNVIAD